VPEYPASLGNNPLQATGMAMLDGLLQRIPPHVSVDFCPPVRQEVDLIQEPKMDELIDQYCSRYENY
jgi:hypothetical protein